MDCPPPRLIRQPVAPMYAACDLLSEQGSQALLGMPVTVLEESAGWGRVLTPDGYRGWVEAAAVGTAPRDWAGPWVEVEDLWANLRRRPDFRLAAVLQAPIGTRLPRRGEHERWTGVLLPDGSEAWTETHRVRAVETGPGRPLSPRAVCRTARRFLGVPYLWGGCSPQGLDCSGIVQLVLRLHGVRITRDAHEQAAEGDACPNPAAADLVFFHGEGAPERITHVGMLLSGGRFIHASGGDRVRVNRLTDAPYAERVHSFRRFVPRRDGK